MKKVLITLLFIFLPSSFLFSQEISGVYETDFNELTLDQNGTTVKGTYKYNGGRIEGVLNGTTLTGWWYQDNGQGKFVFYFNSNFSAFTGKWGNNSEVPSGKWDGNKK